MMMYPFGLWDGGRVSRGPVSRLLLGEVGRSICQIHLHIIRHFFQKVRGNKTTVAVDFTLWMEVNGRDYTLIRKLEKITDTILMCIKMQLKEKWGKSYQHKTHETHVQSVCLHFTSIYSCFWKDITQQKCL